MRVRGFDSFIRKLKRLPQEVQNDIKADIQDAADMIVIDAGNAAPVDLGYLKNSIRAYPTRGGLNMSVVVGAKYAPYVEFGTGTGVVVPDEVKEYAYQFKGKGERLINIPARPFFFPAYFEHRDELIKSMIETLRRNMTR